jgi:hypothetical protein
MKQCGSWSGEFPRLQLLRSVRRSSSDNHSHIIVKSFHRYSPALRPLLTGALLLIVASTGARAQNIQYGISNEFRYGSGERFENDISFHKEYLENLFNTRIYVGDFTLGFRLQVDKPREYGRDTIGIKEYYAEFLRDGLRARGGTFYNLVGRGLVFNTFESRSLGFDTQTEGVKLNYEVPEFAAAAWGGILNYADILSNTRVEEYLIRGASGEVRPIPQIGVGGSFVAASGHKTRQGFLTPFDSYLREGFLHANYEGFRAYLNYADKRTSIDSLTRSLTSSTAFGNGWYGLLGYSSDQFSITGQYKDYRFDVVDPGEQQSNTRSTRALPFQNPATLIPEYDKTLLARNPHAIDINDELGYQFESLIYPTEEMTVTLLAAAGSRHNAWQPSTMIDTTTELPTILYNRINEKALVLPKVGDARYSPYWEFYVQGEYQLNEDQSFTAGIQRRDNVIYHEGDGAEVHPSQETYKATTLMLESMTGFSERDHLHAIVEMQHVYDSKHEVPGNDSLGIAPFNGIYNNVLLTLEYSRSPRWAINTRIEWTTTDEEQGGRHIWPVVGATYRIGDVHTIGVQYGAERGGVVCTGGVCRLINPFTGFRLSVSSKL